MNKIRRGFLYFQCVFFIVLGLVGLFAPQLVTVQLGLNVANIAGTSEIRGLYGGGFAGFGIVILYGMRSGSIGRGLLLAMSIIMGGVVVGRLFSLGIDHEFQFTLPAAIAEFLIALTCWMESKSRSPNTN
jgi:Domain of unknown function (DUF4345)